MSHTPQTSVSRPLSRREQWVNHFAWLDGCDPRIELQQARDEGRDLGEVEAAMQRLIAVPPPDDHWVLHLGGDRDEVWLAEAAALVDAVQALPIRADYTYHEPSDLAGIHAARPQHGPAVPRYTGSAEDLGARILGGVLGRFCGCLLGKPVEGYTRQSIRVFAQETGNWPLRFYWSRPDTQQQARIAAAKPSHLPSQRLTGQYAGEITAMAGDDDVNYTVTGHEIVKQFGSAFTPDDVGRYWLENIPLAHTCTAERAAYRNLANGIVPPGSATHRNPFREWIGAQIRADYFGYANPGDPQRAAEWAWRDASISHVRNGIYGEMWVAAMIAAAYVLDDWEQVIRAGLDQVPSRCRLAQDVGRVRDLYRAGVTWEQAAEAIHQQWNESDQHNWCHTNTNAQVVVLALLWGEDDYEQTITRAVMPGFDTDCNGATSGSLWGVMHGADAIPTKWTSPLNDRGVSSIGDWRSYKITDLAAAMTATALKHRPPV